MTRRLTAQGRRASRGFLLILLMLSASIALSGSASATHQTQTVSPWYSHSWYISSTDAGRINTLGRNDGPWDGGHSFCNDGSNDSSDKVVVLDFGRPIRLTLGGPYFGYGLTMFSGPDSGLDSAVFLAEQYAAGWYATSGSCARLTLAIGTSNSFLCVGGVQPCDPYQFGSVFKDAVHQVQLWLEQQGYAWQINAVGASDMETYGADGWACAGPTRAFVDGFGANSISYKQLWNFGEAITSPGCWSIQDVYYVSWGAATAYPLPEIYNSNFACHWTDGNCRGYGVERSVGPVLFRGEMTECQNGDPIPYGPCTVAGRSEYGPGQAWDQLYQRGQTYGGQPSMWYSTNIRFAP